MSDSRQSPRVHGRPIQAKLYTSEEARLQAQRLFNSAYQAPLRTHIVRLIADYGALTGDQLYRLCARLFRVTEHFAHFERTLASLCQAAVLMILPDISQALLKDGVRPHAPWRVTRTRAGRITRRTDGRLRAYTFSQVGEHLAPLLQEREATGLHRSTPYLHDLLCAEAMLRLSESDSELEPIPAGMAALWDEAAQHFTYKPDGLLIQRVEGEVVGGYVIEFCNETWTAPERAEKKLTDYVTLARRQQWRAWGLTGMPTLLIIYRALSTVQVFRQLTPRLVGKDGAVRVLSLTSVLTRADVELTLVQEATPEERTRRK